MEAASQLAADYRCAYLLDSDPMSMIHRQSSMAALDFLAFSYFVLFSLEMVEFDFGRGEMKMSDTHREGDSRFSGCTCRFCAGWS